VFEGTEVSGGDSRQAVVGEVEMTEVGQKLTKVEGWDKFSLNQRLYLYARVDTATHVAAARDLGLGERWLREIADS